MSDLAAALMVAIRVHAGQRDKQGEPYLLHVLRVVEAVSDKAKVVAALHDCVEDGGDEGKRLVLGLDLTGCEGRVLALLSRNPREHYADYIARMATENATTWTDQNAILLAREVKLADLRDNLGRIPLEPPLADSYLDDSFGRVEEILDGGPHDEWKARWGSLKARYEKAIAVLVSAQRD